MRGILAALLLFACGAAGLAQEGMMAPPAAGQGGSMMMSASASRIVPFNDLATARLLAERGPAVLFFQASACQSCQAALRELQAGAQRLGDVVVLVVDYDREGELGKRYGVSSPHAWVRIDGGGRKLAAWSGGGLEELLRRMSQ
jgi:thiol-disulfide isomerase/thioredoxin